jgi:hydroxymethylbilane synthase
VQLVEVVTEGDRSAAALTSLGGTGVFVAELRKRLLAGEIDLAVHSLKDLPTAAAPGLTVAAIPTRADPRDALVSRDGFALAELPPAAMVGTGSPRRAAQLHATGLGLSVVPIRGNVDTRLRKVADGEVDAIVVAAAGLARLGRLDEASEVLDPAQMLPAPGQGALAVECRADDESLRTALAAGLDDSATRAAATAERIVLARLEAGCTAPVGALADIGDGDVGPEIYLRAAVVAVDGSRALRLSITGPVQQSDELAIRLAAQMLEEGAADLIGESP